MTDPYKTLEVPRDADTKTIKKAYRRLAKEYHPDRNAGKPDAASRFAEISTAYELLSDDNKRAMYDRGEIDENGNRKAPYGFSDFDGAGPFGRGGFSSGPDGRASGFEFSGDASEFASFFGDIFNQGSHGSGRRRRRQSGADLNYRLAVSFEDAVSLQPQRLSLPDGKSIDLDLPVGFEPGTTLRIPGRGDIGPDGNGDVYVTLDIQPHRFFTRRGDDVLLDLPVRWDEAVLGAKVRVPTCDGVVRVNIPRGSTSGRTLRLRERGFHRIDGSRGDQLIRLLVYLPPADEKLEALAREWSKTHADNPRASLGV